MPSPTSTPPMAPRSPPRDARPRTFIEGRCTDRPAERRAIDTTDQTRRMSMDPSHCSPPEEAAMEVAVGIC